MKKIALLIGVSEYGEGLTSLPSALKDIEAMQKVLKQKDIGNFDDVKLLHNPDPNSFRESIEALFGNLTKEDLVFLYFSGHGIRNDDGKLYFSTNKTKKVKKKLFKSSAVPASFVQEIMADSRCKRQVIVLDCCFSGAFAEGMIAKADQGLDLKIQLGGEGCAILTSSSAVQYSFEQQDSNLSIYTRFIVEGLQTGTADMNNDGQISIDELHEYACKKAREFAPCISPSIIPLKEGYSIHLATAPVDDPKLKYRREVEHSVHQGEISAVARTTLESLQRQLGLNPQVAARIEVEVLKPHKEHQQNLKKYEKAFTKAIRKGVPISPFTRQDLSRLKDTLGLEKKEVNAIEAKILPSPKKSTAVNSSSAKPSANSTFASTKETIGQKIQPKNGKGGKMAWIGGVSIAGITALGIIGTALNNPSSNISSNSTPTIPQPAPAPTPTPEPTPVASAEIIPAQKYRDPKGKFVLDLPEGYQIEPAYGDGFSINIFQHQSGEFGGLISVFDSNASETPEEIVSRISNEFLGLSITNLQKSEQIGDNAYRLLATGVDFNNQGREIIVIIGINDFVTTTVSLIILHGSQTASRSYENDVNHILSKSVFTGTQ